MTRPSWVSGIATPSSRRRVDGVEVDATIRHERAVKFDFQVRRSKEVRVNTHAASHTYQYSWVRDSGGDAYNRWPATLLAKVEFGKRWTFGDDYTRQHFGLYKRRFIRHHRRDRHFDFSQDFELPEFRERLLVEMYPGAKPRHASTGWYWVANLLLLTWPCGRGAVARCLRLLSARRRRRDIVLAGTACGSTRSASGAVTSTSKRS